MATSLHASGGRFGVLHVALAPATAAAELRRRAEPLGVPIAALAPRTMLTRAVRLARVLDPTDAAIRAAWGVSPARRIGASGGRPHPVLCRPFVAFTNRPSVPMRLPFRTTRRPIAAAALAAATALAAVSPSPLAAQTSDAEGDFFRLYAGPRNADLDVRSAQFTFDGHSTYRLVSTSFGAIGTTPGAAFVWGIDRGDGRSDFARLGLPDIRFDFLAVLIPDGTSLFVDLVTGQQGALAPGAVRFSGASLEATLPSTLLPSYGLAPTAFTANLWPRSVPVFTDDVISDFAPDDRNITVQVTPEPGTSALIGVGLLTLGVAARRRQRPSTHPERAG